MFNHLKKHKRISEKDAKFYIVNICLAIGFCHENNIIHRDIRPENILMQEDGYLCLSNFGVARKLSSQDEIAKSFFGDPDLDYQSPEMIMEDGHSKSVDWWSVGILAYHFIVGYPPFYDNDVVKKADNIVNGDVTFPVEISDQARAFILSLLEKNPRERLGTKNGLNEIL